MSDVVHIEACALSEDAAISAMLQDVCRISGMGFAAVARVTEDRWIACQVLDRIEFGLKPGDELEVATTICDDIRKTSEMVVIDDAKGEEGWRTHPTPIMYGFKSYISVPIMLSNGRVFGTLCAIDPERRALRGSELVPLMQTYARDIAGIAEATIPTLTGAAGSGSAA